MEYVTLKNINKTYGSYQASTDVNFSIEKGKLVALLGPSGSGKTTILRMIAGLEKQDSGDIIIDGKVVNELPGSKRGIGFVFQNYALFRYMTVAQNIATGLKIQKFPKNQIKDRVDELLELVNLKGLGDRYPNQLSGGQRQRVAFARAIAPNPQLPIYQTSSFKQPDAETLEKIFNNKAMGFSYTRINNPTVEAFEKRVNLLEGGMASVACSSGMAALFNAIVNILQAGDEIVAAAGLYGGTVELFDDLEGLGIKTVYVVDNEPENYESLITDRTKLIFAETIGNPKLDITDIEAVAKLAHSHNIPLIIDNTVATPYLIKPIELGADIVVNSSSKYMNGHSNSISGILTWSGKFKWDYDKYQGLLPYKRFGAMSYIVKLRNGLFRNTGGCLAPQNAFYNTLGLETLGLRMDRECSNALELASFLEKEMGLKVNYPGLLSSKYHTLADRILSHGYGAILTVRVGTKEKAFKIINALKIPYILANIGDTKTLVIHPESTIAAHLSKKEKEQSGVYDDLIRISVGIEDIEDLKQDFKNAIESAEG